jgi:predicted O-methyltransferase YrrM
MTKSSAAQRFGPLQANAVLPEPVYAEGAPRATAMCSPQAAQGDTEWYPPVMLGAQAIGEELTANAPRYVEAALTLLTQLAPDAYGEYVIDFYRRGLRRYGAAWGYVDIVTALLALGERLRPERYLEIGVRRGRSVCAVASVVPDCAMTMFDMWVQNYAGMDNPGPELVERELLKLGHRGAREFISGNSHETLKAYFKQHPDAYFDLITVDGDHSNQGAAEDIADILPRLKIGGVVVFDDVSNPNVAGLGEVWQRMVARNPRFSAFTYDDVGYGVGLGVRKY